MKHIRKYISYILLVVCLVSPLPVYAVGNSWSDLAKSSYFDNHFGQINNKLNGVLYNTDDIKQSFDNFLDEYRSNNNISGSNSQFIADNMTINYQEGDSGDSDVSISQTLREVSRQWSDTYKSSLGFDYFYTFSSALYNGYFTGDKLTSFIYFVDSHDEDYWVLFSTRDNNAFVLIPKENADNFVIRSYNQSYPLYDCFWYKGTTQLSNVVCNKYLYNEQSSSWVETQNTITLFQTNQAYPFLQYAGVINENINTVGYAPVTLNSQAVLVYKNVNSLINGNHGEQDYYVSDSYNSAISGSYNTTTNEIDNSVTSTDVNTYISNYYTDNGSYPTPNQITIYINNYVPSTPEPSPTPTPPIDDGGGGDGGNSPSIWDLLQKVVDFLSRIIGLIASFLAGLVDSLGDVVEGIINILETITNLFIGENGLPNVFSQLITYFLGFIPSEFLMLIELFITCAIILGIVRLIRG